MYLTITPPKALSRKCSANQNRAPNVVTVNLFKDTKNNQRITWYIVSFGIYTCLKTPYYRRCNPKSLLAAKRCASEQIHITHCPSSTQRAVFKGSR